MTSRVTNCCKKKSIWQTCDKVWQYIFSGAERHAHSTLSVQKNRNEMIKWSLWTLCLVVLEICPWMPWPWKMVLLFQLVLRSSPKFLEKLSLEHFGTWFFEWPWSACSELGLQAVSVSKRKFRYAITWHDVRVEQTMNRRMGQAGYLWRRGRNRKKGRQRN